MMFYGLKHNGQIVVVSTQRWRLEEEIEKGRHYADYMNDEVVALDEVELYMNKLADYDDMFIGTMKVTEYE